MTQEKKEAIMRRLEKSRAELLAAVEALTPEQWAAPAYSESDAEWRVLDLLRHVTDSERSMTALMAQIKAGGGGVSEDFDLARWNRRTVAKLQDKGVADLRADMAANRAALLAFIDGLTDKEWEMTGRHGSGLVLTIEQICKVIARHEHDHLADIRDAVAA